MNTSDAASIYELRKNEDPHPTISAGLLNADEIQQYVESVGLIEPFDIELLKNASYGLPLGGHCLWWDETGKRNDVYLSTEPSDPRARGLNVVSRVDLPSNSILFVSLGPTIRLPNYIAARFNLRIRYIYQGLLVGSGPLVDPGFTNILTCPIHNLTDEDYVLQADGKAFAWIEFTKLNATPKSASAQQQASRYATRSLDALLTEANQGRVVRSSIPTAVKKSADSATQARNVVVVAGFSIFVTFLVAVFQLSAQNHALAVTGSKNFADSQQALQDKLDRSAAAQKLDEVKIDALARRLRRVEAKVK